MKKFLLSLMVLASLVSCGKDNKVSSAATSAFSPITTSVQGASELGSKIDNYSTQFGLGQVYYYGTTQTWGALANNNLPIVYRYTKSATANNSNCEKKWGIFWVCSTSSSSGSATESRSVVNSSVNVTEKANQLKAIINSQNVLIPIVPQGTSYRIQSTDGKQYIIDTRYPIQANPIGISDSTGTEYMFNITEN